MALEAITTTGPTITVSTAGELREAYELLAYQPGGGTILMEGGDYGSYSFYRYGVTDGEEPVIIASADPDNPATFDQLTLRGVTNIRIENIQVDSTGVERDWWEVDLLIQDASNIQIADSVFLHDTDNALKDAGQTVHTMSYFRDSSDILFEGNYIDGYFHALQAIEIDGMEIVGNELTNMQGDGFRGGGLQDVTISGNFMHDFYGSDQNLNHSDLIQVWGASADTLTSNLTISDNILLTSSSASQSIFIRNEEFGNSGDPTAGYYENITITDNLIYNSHLHGITVDDTNGLVIDSNTVLWNPDATMIVDGNPVAYQPVIYTRGSLNVTVTNNIASDFWGDNLNLSPEDNNQTVTYDNPAEASYVGNHFVNPFAGVDVSLEDLQMLSTSPWYGTAGSTIGNSSGDLSDGVTAVITTSVAEDDRYEITYDAGSSFDADGLTAANAAYSYHWLFDDGTTAEGMTVTKTYDSGGFKGVELEIRLDGEAVANVLRNFAVQTKDVFAFDFEEGVVDISDGVPEVINNGTTTGSADGTGFLIGDGNKLELGRATENMYALDRFGLALDMTPTGDEQSGVFLHLYQTMTGTITEDGRFHFELGTDEGTFELTSRDPIFDDGGTHRIGIAFDGTTGQLELFADGESVASTEAWGQTAEPIYWNLVFGNTWQDSMDAVIDNVVMSVDPAVAGALADVDPPAEEPPAEDPPAEEPPAEEPPAEDPPAEDPPAEEPPAEDPPAEEPPAEDPPAEDPPGEETDPGGRDAPKQEVEASGSNNFFSKLIDLLLSIFGLGGDDEPAPAPISKKAEAQFETSIEDVVPVTALLDEAAPESDSDPDEIDDEIGMAA